jgi:hypothetical protein
MKNIIDFKSSSILIVVLGKQQSAFVIKVIANCPTTKAWKPTADYLLTTFTTR